MPSSTQAVILSPGADNPGIYRSAALLVPRGLDSCSDLGAEHPPLTRLCKGFDVCLVTPIFIVAIVAHL